MTMIISSDGYSDCVALGEAILHKKTEEASSAAPQSGTASVTTPRPGSAPVAAQTPSAFKSLKVGDLVTLGHYEQDNNTGNGKEPVEWYVLAVEDGCALLLSRYVLDYLPYHSQPLAFGTKISWEDCTLRAWLHNDFLNMAFSEEEKKQIAESTNIIYLPGNKGTTSTQDKIFLLGISDDRGIRAEWGCVPTAYTVAKGYKKSKFEIFEGTETVPREAYGFLERSSPDSLTMTITIDGQEMTIGTSPVGEAGGVRPAVRIRLG